MFTDGRGNSSLTESEIRDFGFTKVGKPVPHGIPMSDVLDSIPKVAFEKDDREAYKSLALTLVACAASQVLIAMVPNWLLPVLGPSLAPPSPGFSSSPTTAGTGASIRPRPWRTSSAPCSWPL